MLDVDAALDLGTVEVIKIVHICWVKYDAYRLLQYLYIR